MQKLNVISDARWQLILVFILFGAYLLIYLDRPASIDGDALLAVSNNLVQHGSPDISELGAPESLLPEMSRMGTIGLDGTLYSKKGITPSLSLLPLTIIANLVPGLSVRAVAMLLNPIVTMLTAIVLFRFVRYLNADGIAAFITALLYGIATLAFPYTQTLFGEPLAALLILWALYELVLFRDRGQVPSAIRCALALGLLVGVNAVYVLLLPVYGIFLFGLNPRKWQFRSIAAFLLPLIISGLALMAYNYLRFGDMISSGYNFAEGEGFNYPLFWGVFGLLISPYRGMFWYSPVLFFAIYGAFKRFDRTVVMALILASLQILLFASWWSWHGGIVWGPRFALPAIPLLMLLIPPAIDALRTSVLGRVSLIFVGLLSIGVQLLGILIDYQAYYAFLYSNFGTNRVEGLISGLSDAVMLNPALSPILGHMKLLGSEALHLSWLRPELNIVHLIAALVLIGIGIITFFIYRQGLSVLVAVLAIPILGLVVAFTHYDVNSLASQIDEQLKGDVVLVASSSIGDVLLDVENLEAFSTNAPTTPDDPLTAALWEDARSRTGSFWFLTWFSPANPENWQGHNLWQNASFVSEIPFNDLRALQFYQGEPAQADISSGASFANQIALTNYGYRTDNNWLLVSLEWEAISQPEIDYSFFVHVLDADGNIIAQQDRPPQGGFKMTSTWSSDMSVLDHLAFMPEQAATARQIRIGWVDWRSGERLATLGGNAGTVSDDSLLLELDQ